MHPSNGETFDLITSEYVRLKDIEVLIIFEEWPLLTDENQSYPNRTRLRHVTWDPLKQELNGEVKWDITSAKEHLPNCVIYPEEKAGVVDKAGGKPRMMGIIDKHGKYVMVPMCEKAKKWHEAICRGERHRQKTGTSKR